MSGDGLRGVADVDVLQAEIDAWARRTFPDSNLRSKFAHLRDELDEILERPGDSHEWADALILLIQAAAFAGHSFSGLLSAVRAKHEINLGRTWGKPDERGVVKHVLEGGE